MANEITIDARLYVANGGYITEDKTTRLLVTQSAIGAHAPVVTVGNGAEEDLAIGDISTLGWIKLTNLDATNYVTYGPKSAGSMVAFGRIKAGETALFRLEPGITLRWQANTASVKVKVTLLEN